jgi:hypothetical protein
LISLAVAPLERNDFPCDLIKLTAVGEGSEFVAIVLRGLWSVARLCGGNWLIGAILCYLTPVIENQRGDIAALALSLLVVVSDVSARQVWETTEVERIIRCMSRSESRVRERACRLPPKRIGRGNRNELASVLTVRWLVGKDPEAAVILYGFLARELGCDVAGVAKPLFS